MSERQLVNVHFRKSLPAVCAYGLTDLVSFLETLGIACCDTIRSLVKLRPSHPWVPGGRKGPLSFGVLEHLKSEGKKQDTFKNWPLIKNPQFLAYPHET